MKYTILKIEKYNWFVCLFTIYIWRVAIEIGGRQEVYDCWGGDPDYQSKSLLWDLEKHIREAYNTNESVFQELIGKSHYIDL